MQKSQKSTHRNEGLWVPIDADAKKITFRKMQLAKIKKKIVWLLLLEYEKTCLFFK
jgi:hypothetical protein